MAQLKDLIVNGASHLNGDSYVHQIQIDSLKARENATATTYGLGANNQLLTSNGEQIYWQTPPFVHRVGDTMTGDLNLVVSSNDETPGINFIRENPTGNDNYIDWRIKNLNLPGSNTVAFSIASRITATGAWEDRAWFEVFPAAPGNGGTTGTFVIDNIKLRNTPQVDENSGGLGAGQAFLPIIMATTTATTITPSNIGELQVVKPNLVINWASGTTDGPVITTNLNGLSTSAAVPIATIAQSGVVTTTAQYFQGHKFSTSAFTVGSLSASNATTTGIFATPTGNIYLSGDAPEIVFKHNKTSAITAKINTTTSNSIHLTPRLLIGNSAINYELSPAGTSTSAYYSCIINNSTDTNALYLRGDMAINFGSISSYYNATLDTTLNIFTSYNAGTQLAKLIDTRTSTTGTVELLLGSPINSGSNNVNGKITLYNTGSTIGSSLTGQRKTLGATEQNCIVADYFQGTQVWGAVWNDYAEFRQTKEKIEPGRCIIETGEGDLILSTERLQNGAEIVSDTYGFAIGQTEKCNTPIASNGRVLAYLYENDKKILKQNIGQPVCSGPDGTVSIMTDQEARDYPWKIIGTISEIPNYEKWQIGNIEDNNFIDVNGRIWIRIR